MNVFFFGFVFPDATKQPVRDLQIADGGGGLRALIDRFGGLRNGNDISRPHRDTRCAFHPRHSPRKHFWPSLTVSWQQEASPVSSLRGLYVRRSCASPDLMWRYRDTGALIQSDGPVRAHYLSRQIVCASISLNSLVSRQRKGKQIKKSINRKPLKFPLLLRRVVRGLGLPGDVLLGRLQDGLSRSDPVTH